MGFGAVVGAFSFQSAFGAGGWLAGGQGATFNVGVNMGKWATSIGQFTPRST